MSSLIYMVCPPYKNDYRVKREHQRRLEYLERRSSVESMLQIEVSKMSVKLN